jgi:hypothetical protein
MPPCSTCCGSGTRPAELEAEIADASFVIIERERHGSEPKDTRTFSLAHKSDLAHHPNGLSRRGRKNHGWTSNHIASASSLMLKKAPPDERGGNRYVRPKETAPHLDSTRFGRRDGQVETVGVPRAAEVPAHRYPARGTGLPSGDSARFVQSWQSRPGFEFHSPELGSAFYAPSAFAAGQVKRQVRPEGA